MNHFYFNYTKVKVCCSLKCTGPLRLIRGAMILNFYNYLELLLHLELTIYTWLYRKKWMNFQKKYQILVLFILEFSNLKYHFQRKEHF